MIFYLLILSQSLYECELLAIKNSPEVRYIENVYKIEESNIKGVKKFLKPSLKLFFNSPSYNYYRDDLYYPGFPYPLTYWQEFYTYMAGLDLSSKIFENTSFSLKYFMLKRTEEYNLYEGRKYYENNIFMSVRIPLFSIFSKDAKTENNLKIRKIEKELKIREIKRKVISLYFDLILYRKLDSILNFYFHEIPEFEDETFKLIKIEKKEIRNKIREILVNIKSLCGISKINPFIPSLPDSFPQILTDDELTLKKLNYELQIKKSDLSVKKREKFSSGIEFGIGFRNRAPDFSSSFSLYKNNTSFLFSLNLPVIDNDIDTEIPKIKEEIKKYENEIELLKEKIAIQKELLKEKILIYKEKGLILKEKYRKVMIESPGVNIEERFDYYNKLKSLLASYLNSLKELFTLLTNCEK